MPHSAAGARSGRSRPRRRQRQRRRRTFECRGLPGVLHRSRHRGQVAEAVLCLNPGSPTRQSPGRPSRAGQDPTTPTAPLGTPRACSPRGRDDKWRRGVRGGGAGVSPPLFPGVWGSQARSSRWWSAPRARLLARGTALEHSPVVNLPFRSAFRYAGRPKTRPPAAEPEPARPLARGADVRGMSCGQVHASGWFACAWHVQSVDSSRGWRHVTHLGAPSWHQPGDRSHAKPQARSRTGTPAGSPTTSRPAPPGPPPNRNPGEFPRQAP